MKKTLVVAIGLAMAGAACSGGDEAAEATPAIVVEGSSAADDGRAANAVDEGDSGVGTDGATDEEMALAFAQCMRDNGVPDFEDPEVDADGSINLLGGGGAGAPGGIDPADPAVQGAFEQCGDLLAGASFLPGADLDTSELEDDFLAFAACLRDLGHDVDDPDLSGGFGPGAGGGGPAGIFGGSFDITDPTNADDVQQCQTVFGAGGPFGGGGN